jgi:hypothetical protein
MKNIIIILLVAVVIGAVIYHWKRYQRFGSVSLDVFPTPAVLGQAVSLTIIFPEGINEENSISGVLVCEKKTWTLEDDSDSHDREQEVEKLWTKKFSRGVLPAQTGVFASIKIDLPSNLPQSTGPVAEPISTEQKVKPEIVWVARFFPPGTAEHSGFEFEVEVNNTEKKYEQ